MEGEDENSGDDRAFNNKSVWARISVVFAGPFFNFIMAFIFALIIICSVGYDSPKLAGVIEGYAAEEAGIKAGDEIVKLNNTNIHFYREISLYSMLHEGETVDVTYLRDGKRHTTTLKPKYDETTKRYLYGFNVSGKRTKPGFGKALLYSCYEVKYNIYTTIEGLKMLCTGAASVNNLSGPVGIVKNMGDTYEQAVSMSGVWLGILNMLNWGVLISANLGVMNLLPIPPLDGGRFVVEIFQKGTRKTVSQKAMNYMSLAGMALFLGFFVIMLNQDIQRFVFGNWG